MQFRAPELHRDGTLHIANFELRGNAHGGWSVFREGEGILHLGPGFRPVHPIFCGVCSTDLVRQFLPYPLPQIVGHEVVALDEGKPVVVEINASHQARGIEGNDGCRFCNNGLTTQCPDRLTLGINQLPGGFAPLMLAPVNAIIELPASISPRTGTFVEPFAAAYHAINATPPKEGESVAVIGPRKLGALLLSALHIYRKQHKINFHITAMLRNPELGRMAIELGADDFLVSRAAQASAAYDLVFDTSGSAEGLDTALQMARRAIHLKSTNGLRVAGMDRMTDLVVDEISLADLSRFDAGFCWPNDPVLRENRAIYLSPSVSDKTREMLQNECGNQIGLYEMSIEDAAHKIQSGDGFFPPETQLPRFDIAIVQNLEEADRVIRPFAADGQEFSLLRPRGIIYIEDIPDNKESALLKKALHDRGVTLHSSRCGDFREAIQAMESNPDIVRLLEEELITAEYSLHDLDQAFQSARDSSKNIKVIVKTDKQL